MPLERAVVMVGARCAFQAAPVRSWVGHPPLTAQSLGFLIAIVNMVIWAPNGPRPCRNDSVFAEAFRLQTVT